MIFLLGFHVGGQDSLKIGIFSPLAGAFIGGAFIFICTNIPIRLRGDAEPWFGNERAAWMLIGCGCIAWGIGESFWRYYEVHGQTPFPSLADFGYSSFPLLVFSGLILLPSLRNEQKRVFLLLDSLISMGALLSIAWFFVLGSLAQAPMESVLSKILGLYYPTADVALVSCAVFLLLRGSGAVHPSSARRISLLVAIVGLCVFACSDFLFNVQNNTGTYVEGTWSDLGWPLGLMALGVAAYLRRFLPATSGDAFKLRRQQRPRQLSFEPAQALPYLLLITLFGVLVFNVLSMNSTQQSIRPVLVGSTLIVIILVLARQILTMLDNTQLMRKQMATLQELEQVNQSIVERNDVLEAGVTHLKEIQTRLANGDVRARAHLVSGELWPLATGLNLMAERMMRFERNQKDAEKVAQAVGDLSQAVERARSGAPLVIPFSCLHTPEIHRLLMALDLKSGPETAQPKSTPIPHRPGSSPLRQRMNSIKQHQNGSGTM
jgi:hypothetical protein